MKTFETASFHIVKPCNMRCKFCYATFDDMHVGPQISLPDACDVIKKLAEAGVEKITFAGGEPLLYRHIRQVIWYAKGLGLTTSIITNGSLLTCEWLKQMRNSLDWIGVSIDSLNHSTNLQIGRNIGSKAQGILYYNPLVWDITGYGYKLKVNTVVNAYNKDEDFNAFIQEHKPARWKVFQALRVEGQNDEQFDEVKVTAEEYQAFLDRHRDCANLVPEDNEAMTGSYLLIDPLGRLFENSQGRHTYSDSLIGHDFTHCQAQLQFNRDMFIQRGGIYNW